MPFLKPLVALVFALGAIPATAAVVTANLGVSFATTPYTFSFGNGANVTFTLVDASRFAPDPAGVSTVGSTQILSLGAPFYNPPRPTSFFTDRGGSIGPATLGQYLGYAAPTAIPFSLSESIVGLRFNLGQGFQYGYADIAGSTLYGFRYETTPGASVNIAGVPEPAAWALMITGFGCVGLGMRGRRRNLAV